MIKQTIQFIGTIGIALICFVIAWTVGASLVFLTGTGLLHDYWLPFWQWWLYALNFDGNRQVALWLKIGAVGGMVIPIVTTVAATWRRDQ